MQNENHSHNQLRMWHSVFAIVLLFLRATLARADSMHVIQVIDDTTGRGVPCVQLETVNQIQLITDSNGIAVFDETGLLNTKVFFNIAADGYEYPKDGFGYAGVQIDTTISTKTIVKIHRTNIAERLYRITGEGIYGQTVRAGKVAGVSIPISHPVLDSGVLGQDTVQTIIYHDKLYWFWGDTQRASYPLGNFRSSGAISDLPGHGGLDPTLGINLHYFTGTDGFSRGMVVGLPPDGPVWIDALMVVRDPAGNDRLICKYARIKSLAEQYSVGLLQWNDKAEQFEPLIDFAKEETIVPAVQPIRIHETTGDYFYFPTPYATLRVRADWQSIRDPRCYEAFTCIKSGQRPTPTWQLKMDRDSAGHLIWSWKPDANPISQSTQKLLIFLRKIKPEEAWLDLRDEQGNTIYLAAGTVCWNEYVKKWIMITNQLFGNPSSLGEVWYAQADHPWGPFRKAVKIVSHHNYTFYNPVQHPQFDQAGGRLIYFEGTYANTFSSNDHPTPRYDYNQMMYRLDLADPRLKWAEN